MSTAEDIIAARFDPAQFLRLREELDRIEPQLWEAEQTHTVAELDRAGVTGDEIERLGRGGEEVKEEGR